MTTLFSFAILAATAALIFSQSAVEENALNPVVDASSTEEARARSERAFRRMLPSLPTRNQNRARIHDIEALRQTLENGDWSQVGNSPAIPPTEADCYVEVQLIQKIPGRCTRLGGRIPACQAQDLLTIAYAECGN